EAEHRVLSELRQHFRPEFLNRVDETILFSPLKMDEIIQIVDLLVANLKRRLKDRNMDIELTDDAREFIAEAGFDPIYGARPLKRYLQRALETKVAKALLAGDAGDGARIHVGVVNGELDISILPPDV